MSTGNLILLNRTTISSASSYAINSLITSTYNSYVIRFSVSPSISGAALTLQASANNGGTYLLTNYSDIYRSIDSGAETSITSTTTGASWSISAAMGASSYSSAIGEIKLFNMITPTKYKHIRYEVDKTNAANLYTQIVGSGRLDWVVVTDALKFSISTGVMTGTFSFFGVDL